VGIIILVIITGYELYRSITGANQEKQYSVIEIEDHFDQEVLNFLTEKKDEVRVDKEEI
jgi:hypothetical protein